MNTWYLVVLETHLFWPGFLEKLPVATTISNEIKYEYPWIKVTNNRDRPLPNRAKFDYWCERKIFFFFYVLDNTDSQRYQDEEKFYCSSVSVVWWHKCKDCGGFSKQSPGRYWPKKVAHFDKLRIWQKTDVNRRLLINFF